MPEAPPDELLHGLELTRGRRGTFGNPFYFYTEIGSTNDRAAELAEAGAPEGTSVVAASQTAGRGRFGRTWFSPPGAGLYVSVVVRQRRAASLLTLAGGVALAEGISTATGLRVEIKWPNDIVVEGGLGRRRKLAGILAEASTGVEGLQYVVLGFGINMGPAAYPPEISDRATSLELELGRPVDRGLVLSECLAALAEQVGRLSLGESQSLLDQWLSLSPSAQGSTVEWDTPEGPKKGRTGGIDPDGALLVRTSAGTERILSGAVRWLQAC